jgi:cyclomaltodextrinase / maltogenic alpha-amylase / neopullulanase
VLAEPGEKVYDTGMDITLQHWQAVIPGQPSATLVRYRADGWSLRYPQMYWYADNMDPLTIPSQHRHLFAYHVGRWPMLEWWDDAVIYQVFVDRFSTASNEPALRDPDTTPITGFFGGTLRGIIEKLDYIQALGVNCIWLSPIFESPTSHGYNPSDHYHVAKRFGTNDMLRQLIDEAHQRGIRVILDFVTNHTSDKHPLFLYAQANRESLTTHWYSFDYWLPHGYRSFHSVEGMPELVTEDLHVQQYLVDAALYWLDNFGVDGFRLDYVPGPTRAFWTVFQREIKQRFPQALTLGEITAPLSEIAAYAGRLDAFMDFPLARMLRRVFGYRKAPLVELLAFLDESAPHLPPRMGRATLLDNHDMHRFLWLACGNTAQLKLAAVCHMTLEGTPLIYYGTEVGLSQYNEVSKTLTQPAIDRILQA